jgi:hypothetical protein
LGYHPDGLSPYHIYNIPLARLPDFLYTCKAGSSPLMHIAIVQRLIENNN